MVMWDGNGGSRVSLDTLGDHSGPSFEVWILG